LPPSTAVASTALKTRTSRVPGSNLAEVGPLPFRSGSRA